MAGCFALGPGPGRALGGLGLVAASSELRCLGMIHPVDVVKARVQSLPAQARRRVVSMFGRAESSPVDLQRALSIEATAEQRSTRHIIKEGREGGRMHFLIDGGRWNRRGLRHEGAAFFLRGFSALAEGAKN